MTQQTLPLPTSDVESSTWPARRRRREAKEAAITLTRGGMWAWLLQRITAGVLLFGLTSHLVATHVMAIGQLSDSNIALRLASSFFVVVDVSLLAAGVFHGLNGVRMVILDYGLRTRSRQRALSGTLWLIGIAVFIYGMWALWPWIG
jgi:succinate dehydrogenase cytochrome b556 subunit